MSWLNCCGHRHKRDALPLEDLHHPREVEQRSAQPIDLVHHHAVDLPCFDIRQQLLHRGSFQIPAGEAAVVVPLRQTNPTFRLLAGHVRLAGLALRIQRAELLLQPLGSALTRVDRTADRRCGSALSVAVTATGGSTVVTTAAVVCAVAATAAADGSVLASTASIARTVAGTAAAGGPAVATTASIVVAVAGTTAVVLAGAATAAIVVAIASTTAVVLARTATPAIVTTVAGAVAVGSTVATTATIALAGMTHQRSPFSAVCFGARRPKKR